MVRSPPCCCCFSNNVRHLVLLLSVFSVSLLFANLILFNLTAILNIDLPDEWKPVASLTSLHEYTTWHDRLKRDTGNDSTIVGNSRAIEGHPILPAFPARPDVPSTTSLPKTTTKRLVFFTNSPTAPVRDETTVTRLPRATTAFPSVTTEKPILTTRGKVPNVVLDEVRKAIEKFEHPDKDLNNNDNNADIISDDDGKTKDMKEPHLDHSSSANLDMTEFIVRCMIYAAPGIGIVAGVVPSILLMNSFGVRITFTAAMLLSSIAMIILPFMTHISSIAISVTRFLLGVAFSASFPMMGSMIANWGTLKEQLFFLTSMLLFLTIGPLLSWPISFLLYSNEVMLTLIYALHAVPTFMLAIIFLIFYRDLPEDHPWVNGLELNRIVAGKVQEIKKNRVMDTPCCTLIRSVSAYSIWVSAFGFFAVIALFAEYLPSFLSSQQIFMVDYLGSYGVLPYLGIPFVFLVGGLLNRMSVSSKTILIRIFNTMSFILTALFVLVLPILFYADKTGLAQTSLLLSLAPLGLVVSGFLRSTIIVGRAYSKHIISFYGMSFGIAFIVIPVIVGCLVLENSLKEWLRIFLVIAAILLVCAVVFAVFGQGISAGWAESSWDPLVSTKMRSLNPIDRSQDECGLYEMRLITPHKL